MPFVTHADAGVDGGGGVASTFDDFVRNKLVPFITSSTHFPSAGDRWTKSKADVNIGTNEWEIFLTPPSGLTAGVDKPAFMAFHTRAQGVFMFPSLAFDAATPAYDQPQSHGYCPANSGNNPVWTETAASPTTNAHNAPWVHNAGAGPYLGHYLFAPSNGRYCYGVVQTATRKWRHMWFGSFDKYGSFTGGEFVSGFQWDSSTASTASSPYSQSHNPPTAVANSTAPYGRFFQYRALISAMTWWATTNQATVPPGGVTFIRPAVSSPWSNVNNTSGTKTIGTACMLGMGNTLGTTLFRLNASLIAGAKQLLPHILFCWNLFDGNYRRTPIGEIPDVFRINMKGLTPGQAITLGSDTYRVFPVTNSDTVNTVLGEEYSGYEGYAYRVRT